jgi:hypothetical protein
MNTSALAEIVSVTLTPEQSAVLGPVVEQHREATGVVGLVGALTRSYREKDGRAGNPGASAHAAL